MGHEVGQGRTGCTPPRRMGAEEQLRSSCPHYQVRTKPQAAGTTAALARGIAGVLRPRLVLGRYRTHRPGLSPLRPGTVPSSASTARRSIRGSQHGGYSSFGSIKGMDFTFIGHVIAAHKCLDAAVRRTPFSPSCTSPSRTRTRQPPSSSSTYPGMVMVLF